jgi:putative transposase
MPEPAIPWPHAPTHQLSAAGAFFVTAATYKKEHYFRGAERLQVLHRGLLTVARDYGWRLEAWAVFSNHYHFIGHSPPESASAGSLPAMLKSLHARTASWLNKLDMAPDRQVWHNFWETRLTFAPSYFARLKYTHQNPVRHGLVAVANQYHWCSAAWFERNAPPAQVKTIYRFNTTRMAVPDDFDPAPEW